MVVALGMMKLDLLVGVMKAPSLPVPFCCTRSTTVAPETYLATSCTQPHRKKPCIHAFCKRNVNQKEHHLELSQPTSGDSFMFQSCTTKYSTSRVRSTLKHLQCTPHHTAHHLLSRTNPGCPPSHPPCPVRASLHVIERRPEPRHPTAPPSCFPQTQRLSALNPTPRASCCVPLTGGC